MLRHLCGKFLYMRADMADVPCLAVTVAQVLSDSISSFVFEILLLANGTCSHVRLFHVLHKTCLIVKSLLTVGTSEDLACVETLNVGMETALATKYLVTVGAVVHV